MSKVTYIFSTIFYSNRKERISFFKTAFYLAVFIMLISLFCITAVKMRKKPVAVSKPKIVKIIKSESRWAISKYDSIELSKLIPILKKREGLRLKPYKGKGGNFIGYGHLILSCEKLISINESQADSLLYSDIQKAYIEYSRIHAKQMSKEVYNIFISGKPVLNKKEK